MNVRGPAALVVGLHLGCMQTGYLLTLSRALSSAHTTYALVLAAWLGGAALGLWVTMGQRLAIVVGLVAYLGVVAGLSAVDFVAWPAWCFAPAENELVNSALRLGSVGTQTRCGAASLTSVTGRLCGRGCRSGGCLVQLHLR